MRESPGNDWIGKRIERVDGAAKLSGRCRFLGDIRIDGLLHAKQVPSSEAHARILSLDCEAARGAPGDRAVFFQHSLAHPRVLADLAGRYELTLLSWKLRVLGHDEYGSLQEWFVERSTAGTSFVGNANGRRHLIAGVWMAELR